jgi:hypothetical protein
MLERLIALIEDIKEKIGLHGEVATGVSCIALGLIVCFFGRRLLRPTLAVAGFAVGVLFTKPLLESLHRIFDPQSQLLSLENDFIRVLPMVGGVVLGVLFMSLISLGMYLLAAAGGVVLFSVVKDLMKTAFSTEIHPYIRIGVLVLAGLLPILLAKLIEGVVVSLATSILGSAVIMVGIDVFTKVGFFDSLKRFWRIKDHVFDGEVAAETAKVIEETVVEVKANREVLFMFLGFGAMAAAGSLYQMTFTRMGRKDDCC